MTDDFNSAMWIVSFILPIISLSIALLGLPFILSKWKKLLPEIQQKLHRKLSNYNKTEKVIIATRVPAVPLAFALIILAVLQFLNSIPTLFSIQNLPANSIPRFFPDLMWFGVFSGIICLFVGTILLKINLKELRIVFSPKTF